MELTVAKTIFNQLGGNKFAIMTGVKNLAGDENGLQFSIMKNASGINKVRIDYIPGIDLYTMVFYKVRKYEFKEIARHEEIYFDMMVDIFEKETGLYTSL